jgi:ketosteroid isomerase-like protein
MNIAAFAGRFIARSGGVRRSRGPLAVLFAGALIAAFAIPRSGTGAQPIGADEAAVLAADNALGDALRAGNKSATRRLLALQFSFVDADGKYYARKDFLADLKGLAAGPASDATVRSYGLLTAVTGHRRSALNTDVFFLDIWARQKGAWRALVRQDVLLATADAPPARDTGAAPAPSPDAQPSECKNPCQSVPYRVRSVPEQEVTAAFEALEKAIVAHDSAEYSQHVADEFVVYRSGRLPAGKSARVAAIARQKEDGAPVAVATVESLRLAVYGDAATMTADQVMPDNSRPRYRAARLWVKRGGQWLLAIAVQTDVK